jgi:hypothetical protein
MLSNGATGMTWSIGDGYDAYAIPVAYALTSSSLAPAPPFPHV